MSKGFASSYRIVLLATGLVACFAGLGTRLVWLHVMERETWLARIEKTRSQTIVEKARRGDILDARGALLATSRPQIIVGVDPGALVHTEQEHRKWPQLALLLGMPLAELEDIFTTKFRTSVPATPAPAASPVPASASLVFNFGANNGAGRGAPAPAARGPESVVADAAALPGALTETDSHPDAQGRQAIRWVPLAFNVPEETFHAIEKLGLKGVYAPPPNYTRVYPNHQLAAHIVGYVNRDEEPAAGIEYYTDFYLRGQNGWREGERDGRRRELPQFNTRRVPAANGYSVMLSIDSTVQDIVEQELALIVRQFQPVKASIIVSDPRTGFILGMANTPTFDLNAYGKAASEDPNRLRNIAVADIYEPGSVFKIVAAAGAIEESLVTRDMTFDCSVETVRHRGHDVDMPEEDHRIDHAQALTIGGIISHSSNRGAALLALRLGEERFDRYARAFGFGRELGFPVGGEVAGLLRPVKKWHPIDITRIAMGHSVSSTVLQMHQAMSVIANDGVLLRPQVIREIRDAAGDVVFRYNKVELTRAVSPDTARAVALMLQGVVSPHGTAARAAIDGYDVAGKTGTSQKLVEVVRADGTKFLDYSTTKHIASFVGFFPASNPQVAISIVVDEAKVTTGSGIAYGGVVAAPSFKTIGEKLIPIRDIKPASPTAARLPVLALHEGGRR